MIDIDKQIELIKRGELHPRVVDIEMDMMDIRRADKRRAIRRKLLSHSILLACALVHTNSAFAWFWSTPTWQEVKRKIRAEYPGISQITIVQLQELLKRPDTFRLVDARAASETSVSHLPGAVFYNSTAQIAQAFSSNKNQNIVIYCSVGWRSAKIVSELQSMGFTQVSNLEGSIFEWANEGLPVFRGRERVKTVHPFDSTWQVLLKPELRALQ